MTIKEIKEHYKVDTYDRGKTLMLSHKTEHGRTSVSKFLVALDKVKPGVYQVQASKCPNSHNISHCSIPTAQFKILKQLIEWRLRDYDYDSEFYNPMFREGYMEELAVRDHITNRLEFKFLDSQWDIDAYEKSFKGAYGKGEYKMLLNISGLDLLGKQGFGAGRVENDKVNVNLLMRDGSWISLTCTRNPREICESIDSLIKPEILVLAKNLVDYSHILDAVEINPKQKTTSGMNIITKDIKKDLIQQLEETLKQLKGQ